MNAKHGKGAPTCASWRGRGKQRASERRKGASGRHEASHASRALTDEHKLGERSATRMSGRQAKTQRRSSHDSAAGQRFGQLSFALRSLRLGALQLTVDQLRNERIGNNARIVGGDLTTRLGEARA